MKLRIHSRLPSATEHSKELNEMEEPLGTSPPLELRRTMTGQRVAVPHSLQSPQDRATSKYHFSHFTRNITERKFLIKKSKLFNSDTKSTLSRCSIL